MIHGDGGCRGPDFTYIADRLSTNEMILRIMNRALNMPAFSSILNPTELNDLVAFLQTRKSSRDTAGEAQKTKPSTNS